MLTLFFSRLTPVLFFLSVLSLFINQAPHNATLGLTVLSCLVLSLFKPKIYLSHFKENLFFYTLLSLYLALYILINWFHFYDSPGDLSYALRRVRWAPFTMILLPVIHSSTESFKNPKLYKPFIYGLSLLTLLIVFDSVTRFLWQDPSTSLWFKNSLENKFTMRASWTYNPIPFSKMAVFSSIIFTLSATFSSKKVFKRIFFTLALLMLTVAILSLTRATWLGLICVFPLFLLKQKNIKIICTALTFAFLAGLAVLSQPDLKQRITSASTKNFSIRYRVEHFKANVKVISDHPLLGIGYSSNRKKSVMKPYLNEFHKDLSRVYNHPHNEYLDVGAGMGLISLALFLLILSTPLILKLQKVSFFKLNHTDFFSTLFLLFIYTTAAFDKLTLTSWTMIIVCWAILLSPKPFTKESE